MPLNILIIDDDTEITDQLLDVAVRSGHQVTVENDSRQVESLLTTVFDLIFLDLRMPFLDGIEVMRVLSEKKVSAALVLMSGFDKSVLNTARELAEAHELNVLSHLSKPLKDDAIEALMSGVRHEKVEQISKPVDQRQMSSDDIRKAFDEDRIEVHYQPQMDVKMNRVVGLEALCRIRDSQNNLIYPDLFIDEVERLGLIHELTLAVTIIAAQDYADLSAEYSGMTISINISTRDLDDLHFPDVLETIFAEHKINPNFIIIEVTENVLLQNLSVSLDVLARIRLKGFKISIDDFGKGSAALDNLKYFPATELKIHREFIQSIGEKDKSHVLVKHTMELAHHLGLDVVAQGVENKEVLDWLVDQGCDIIQGYWYSKPLSKADLLGFLKTARAGRDIDSTFSGQDNDASLEGLKIAPALIQDFSNDDDTPHDQVIISSILPLTGSFTFIGNSQLYGIKAALKEYHYKKTDSDTNVKLEVFDDQSDINRYMELAKKQISNRSLACLGGVFTLGNMRWFIQTALAMKIAVIGAFTGSVLLRDAKWSNLFNVRPSYENELASIAEHLRQKHGKILFVYPDNAFGKRSAIVFDKLIRSEHLRYGLENRSPKFLIESINKSNAMHIVFIGGTKSFADIINEVSLRAVSFYSISLVGLGSLMRYSKDCQNHVFVTAPIEDYQSNLQAATQYRKYIKSFLTDSTTKYRNSISFESYLNTLILLKGLAKCPTHRKLDLIQALEGLSGIDVGLSSPVTWDPEKRQFLHKAQLLDNKVCR